MIGRRVPPSPVPAPGTEHAEMNTLPSGTNSGMAADSSAARAARSDPARLIAAGRRALEIESRAVADLVGRVDEHFVRACGLCLASRGRVAVSGLGKSGHVGSKIAATLASTGTPAFFLHAAEASHG